MIENDSPNKYKPSFFMINGHPLYFQNSFSF